MKYTPPKIQLFVVELESGICAGSATVLPQNSNYNVKEEWEEIEEPVRTIDW